MRNEIVERDANSKRIVARLRYQAGLFDTDEDYVAVDIAATLREAAALIERQEQRIRELEGALEVFAKAADTHSEKMPDQMFIDDYEHASGEPWKSAAGLTVGDLRRARAAIQKEE